MLLAGYVWLILDACLQFRTNECTSLEHVINNCIHHVHVNIFINDFFILVWCTVLTFIAILCCCSLHQQAPSVLFEFWYRVRCLQSHCAIFLGFCACVCSESVSKLSFCHARVINVPIYQCVQESLERTVSVLKAKKEEKWLSSPFLHRFVVLFWLLVLDCRM